MKKAVAAVVIGLFLWFILLVIHEEWRLPSYQAAFGPPPFNPFNLWTPAVLIVGIWALLVAFVRWAERQLDGPVPRRR